jgi:hypothetical protein
METASFDAPDAQHLGAEAFVFGFPLMVTMAAMRRATNALRPGGARAPINQFAHLEGFPDPDLRAIVAANAHTLYSFAWLDLSTEPVLLDLPDTDERSYLMPLVDAWTAIVTCFGPRTAGTLGGTYGLVGPGWSGSLPAGVQRVDMPTNTAWMTSHIHATGSNDLDAGRAVQRSLTLTPLSVYGGAYKPPAGSIDVEIDSKPAPHRLVMEMGAEEFLVNLAAEMGANPPDPDDDPFLERLATIGLYRGQPFAWANLPSEIRKALESGLTDGKEEIGVSPPQRVENGWETVQSEAQATTSIDNYVRRARAANVALGTANCEDASFATTVLDSDERRINGSQRYVMHFEPGGLPPVGALWSLGLYDMYQLLVDNPIDRYALGDRDELELGPDGSLEIVIQHDRPDGSDANWLPAPEGDFNLMLHMYWPGQRVLDGSWTIPPLRRVS